VTREWAEDGEQPSVVYVGPANQQLTVTAGRRLALGPATGFRRSRPTADRLFETVARCYGRTAVGLVFAVSSMTVRVARPR
jgi:chemotaxis response regulator CheB